MAPRDKTRAISPLTTAPSTALTEIHSIRVPAMTRAGLSAPGVRAKDVSDMGPCDRTVATKPAACLKSSGLPAGTESVAGSAARGLNLSEQDRFEHPVTTC